MTTPMPEPSPAQPDEDLSDLLNEIRLLLPGTLLLVAFLIALPFNTGYTRVSQFDNAVYVALFLCAILSLLLFAAPAAQHRLMSPLRDRAAFPDVAVKMVEVGESTGALQEMLNSLADFYDEEIETNLGRFITVIEPLLLVVMGIVIAGLLLSLYLPLFNLSSALSG